MLCRTWKLDGSPLPGDARTTLPRMATVGETGQTTRIMTAHRTAADNATSTKRKCMRLLVKDTSFQRKNQDRLSRNDVRPNSAADKRNPPRRQAPRRWVGGFPLHSPVSRRRASASRRLAGGWHSRRAVSAERFASRANGWLKLRGGCGAVPARANLCVRVSSPRPTLITPSASSDVGR